MNRMLLWVPCGAAMLAGLVAMDLATAGVPLPDSDFDGIPDGFDNCVNTFNPSQCDTGNDGYGGACDGDFNNDGQNGTPDFNIIRANFGGAPTSVETDTNCDGVVGNPDFSVFRSVFGGSPGPSGLTCAGSPPCPPLVSSDSCFFAWPVLNETVSDTTIGKDSDGQATCAVSSTTADTWFRYSADADGTLTVNTCNSDFDTVVSIHADQCPGNQASEIACNDDGAACNGGTGSEVSIAMLAGESVRVRVSGNSGGEGNFQIVFDGPGDGTPPSPDPMAITSLTPGPGTVDVLAVTATDPNSVEYGFQRVSPTVSALVWGPSPGMTLPAIPAGAFFEFVVLARDALGNQTAPSPPLGTYSGALPPLVDASSTASSTVLEVEDPANAASVEYAVRCALCSDPTWDDQWIAVSGGTVGVPGGTDVSGASWLTSAEWDAVTLGTQPATEYCWNGRGRNVVGDTSVTGSTTCETTPP